MLGGTSVILAEDVLGEEILPNALAAVLGICGHERAARIKLVFLRARFGDLTPAHAWLYTLRGAGKEIEQMRFKKRGSR